MRIITTDFAAGKRWHEETIEAGSVDCVHQLSLYPDVRRQTFEGFGGAFTEAAAVSWASLPAERRQAFM